ncbi:choline BCCT transporter BetT [Actinomyces gaoshouyii]|uniref:choline BCCT transporter BetT n=1 Tax=Actinomyces gaoshouyii TaxID=1960083 RepID=UPI0009BF6C2F|nr:choline BCCT transporter BetT [Actinomyces gaoshouyii]ARD41057.1 high-affinity choline transporter BetT [Actinomyces gaoshouyii]
MSTQTDRPPLTPQDSPGANDSEGAPDKSLNTTVFVISGGVIGALALTAILVPRTIQGIFDTAVAWASRWFGSFYILEITAVLVFVVFLALSRYGTTRLGPSNSTPEFSTFSWAAMLFAAGVGTGIMFFAVAEPVSQYLAPPTGAPETEEAARNAIVLTLLHYGVSGWGLYSLLGMSLAYFAYRRRQPLAVRATLRPILGHRTDGILGDVVDAAALIGGAIGIAASLGVGIVQLNVALTILFGIPQGTAAQIGLVALSVLMATASAVSGVDRGVRMLSNINVLLAIALALWVLITGDTAFLLDALVGSIGDYVTSFPGLTLETYAWNRPAEWLNGWTLFFWAWWITWAAFVGVFLARISRGRTIRQFVLGSLALPLTYVIMWVSIFGNHALSIVRGGDRAFTELTASAPEQGFYALLKALPGGPALVALSLFIGILFYVTSADSGALVMANLSTRTHTGDEGDARPWLRIFWAVLVGVLTIAMLLAGGIPILQQATIVMALPFSAVLLLVMYGLWKALYTEASHRDARSHVFRNRALGLTGTAAGLKRISWRDRLSHTFESVSPAQAQRALGTRIVPALEAVAAELRKEDLVAEVYVEGPEAQDPDDERNFLGRATLLVTAGPEAGYGENAAELAVTPTSEGAAEGGTVAPAVERSSGLDSFRYVVRMVQAPVAAFGVVVHEADDLTVRLEVRPRGGGQGYDVMDWTADQVAHDVLDHYESWLDYLGNA